MNFLVNCVLFVEFIEGEKLLMCVEVCIILAVALSMQRSLCSLQRLPVHVFHALLLVSLY